MACFVSYIYMFVLLCNRRVFLQLWLLFIDKDIARAYVAVAGGRRRACGHVVHVVAVNVVAVNVRCG